MKKEKIKILLSNIIYPCIALLVIIIVWAIASAVVGSQLLIPSIDKTLASFVQLFTTQSFYKAVGGTLIRVLYSFCISLVLALIFAVLSTISRVFERVVSPFITIIRSVPTMSVILIAIIWLSGQSTPILVAFVLVFPMLYNAFLTSFQSIDPSLLAMAKVFNISSSQKIKSIYLPAFVPSLIKYCGSGLSMNLKLIIASEVLAQTSNSIGLNMQISKMFLDTPNLFAWTIVAIILGALLELVAWIILKIYNRKYYGNQ